MPINQKKKKKEIGMNLTILLEDKNIFLILSKHRLYFASRHIIYIFRASRLIAGNLGAQIVKPENLIGREPRKEKENKNNFPNPSRPNLTIASLPLSPSTAAPLPSSSNHQPPATATTTPPFSLSLARALAFSLSNTHSALPQFVWFCCFPFWVEGLQIVAVAWN